MAVHGIGQYQPTSALVVAAELTAVLRSALADGIDRYCGSVVPVDLRAVYYSHLLRNPDEQAAVGDESTDEEQGVIDAWAVANGVPFEVAQGWVGIPLYLAANWIARRIGRGDEDGVRRRISGLASNLARDACRYLHRPERRAAVRAEVAQAIAAHRPHVVVAHSLGSVVVYETLWAYPELTVDRLVTVGSPLAMPGAIFDFLQPAPLPEPRLGHGTKPPNVGEWFNVADPADVVAVPRPLHARFQGLRKEDDRTTSIGPVAMHSFAAYLQNRWVVRAVTAAHGD